LKANFIGARCRRPARALTTRPTVWPHEIEAEIVAHPTHPLIRGLEGARKARIRGRGWASGRRALPRIPRRRADRAAAGEAVRVPHLRQFSFPVRPARRAAEAPCRKGRADGGASQHADRLAGGRQILGCAPRPISRHEHLCTRILALAGNQSLSRNDIKFIRYRQSPEARASSSERTSKDARAEGTSDWGRSTARRKRMRRAPQRDAFNRQRK
jgi:hypothetical protein